MAKSGWTDEDEKALLDLLQRKWHSGNSGSGYAAGSSILTPLESQGAMTDGSKRLLLPMQKRPMKRPMDSSHGCRKFSHPLLR